MTDNSLRWEQVHGWRLMQHRLLQRADAQKLVDIVTRVGGVHAQLMSAAELSLGARVDGISSIDVQNALWRDRTVVKTRAC